MSVLSIRGLGRRYGAVTGLAGLDLDVAASSRTAVVGPSGSGKTTLLRLIAGFEAPDTGTITLDGHLIADAQAGVPSHRRNVGLVMQEGALFPHLSVIDNIRFGIRDQSDSEAQALKLLDLVELPRDTASRAPHQLSGGQQQRVALARALARRPRLMLLDEPFSALDTGLRAQLRQATAAILAEADIATLLVTHDRDEAMAFGDQLVVLHEGRLAQAGRPQDLYLMPANETVATFLGPAILLSAHVQNAHAETLLGPLPVQPDAIDGPARVLVRPEQLGITPSDEGTWTLRSLGTVGARHTITVESARGDILTFDTSTGAVSPGDPVQITISGHGWALPPPAPAS